MKELWILILLWEESLYRYVLYYGVIIWEKFDVVSLYFVDGKVWGYKLSDTDKVPRDNQWCREYNGGSSSIWSD